LFLLKHRAGLDGLRAGSYERRRVVIPAAAVDPRRRMFHELRVKPGRHVAIERRHERGKGHTAGPSDGFESAKSLRLCHLPGVSIPKALPKVGRPVVGLARAY